MAETFQIRNVPPELHAAVAKRAREEGLTISEYLLRRIAQIEGKPPIGEVLRAAQERMRGKKRPRPGLAAELIREDRDR
ncbi:hypothetical protein [Thermoactinospora rubra]|uniref:hypothetical protein n=1 Tax=Thermoactinospora rubra TaxID=1088767 RepID=UPI000A0F7643|nr:hypothetical protein [Thermoactinospora rubra]